MIARFDYNFDGMKPGVWNQFVENQFVESS